MIQLSVVYRYTKMHEKKKKKTVQKHHYDTLHIRLTFSIHPLIDVLY